MDIVEFVEDVCGLKLYEYQKKLLVYMYEHPEYKPTFRRADSRINKEALFYYLISLYKEKENEQVSN